MGEDDVDGRVVGSLACEKHVLHCTDRVEWVLSHGIGMPDCGALAAWCRGVHEDRYAAAIEELEDGVENCITEVGTIGIGIETYPVELQDVEAVLVVSDQDI